MVYFSVFWSFTLLVDLCWCCVWRLGLVLVCCLTVFVCFVLGRLFVCVLLGCWCLWRMFWVGCLLFWFVIAIGFGYWLLDVAFGIWYWFDLFRWFGWYVAVLLCLFAGCCFGCCVVLLWLFLGLRRTVCLRVCGFWCFGLYLL